MILKIALFLSYAILVSANNGFPVIPAQTYPIYQQNGYANPFANQQSDISSYLQNMMVQNESPTLNLSPSNIRQILLNTILSNQPTQTIFDQNSQIYGSNLNGFPNNPVASNPVSNYFAAPTVYEYLNNQTGTNKDNEVADIKTEGKRKRGKKRKSSKSRRKNESQKNHNNSNKNDKINDVQDNNREASKKSRKHSRKSKIQDSSHHNHTKNSENENNKKKKKRKNKESEVNNLFEEEIIDENPKPRKRHKKKPKHKDNKENIISEQQITSHPKQIQEDLNLANFNEGIVEENRVPRNPTLEGNNLFKSIPNLPENIANSFNFKGLPQFNNNPSMSNFFANYENIYQSMLSNNMGTIDQREIKRGKPKRSRTNNKRKIEVKNRNSTSTATVLTNSKPTDSPKINVVTTEKTIYIKEKTHTNINPIPKDEDSKQIDKPSEVKEATVIEFENEEFEDIKDIESNINNSTSNYDHIGGGYIDDYYPQFTDNVGYTANNREVYIKNLGDTKYYYAIDKRNPDLINRMRFEGFELPQRVIKDYELNKKYDDAEKEPMKNDVRPDFRDIKEEVIQFRSPPHLESPDFQTRKVEKSEINPEPYYNSDENEDSDHRFVGDKASVYSEAKIPHDSGIKQNSRKLLKDKHKDVEILFTRSKVANYGPVYYPEEDITSVRTSNLASTDDNDFKDEGTAYVFANSLDYPN